LGAAWALFGALWMRAALGAGGNSKAVHRGALIERHDIAPTVVWPAGKKGQPAWLDRMGRAWPELITGGN